jgi:hypothetical protein
MACRDLSQPSRTICFTVLLIPVLCAAWGMGCGGSTASPPAHVQNEPAVARDRPVGTGTAASIPNLHGVDFVDVARERGLEFRWPQQQRPLRALDAFGCGCAAFDADNDGWQDVLLVGDPRPALYHNIAGVRFEEAAGESWQQVSGNWKGCAIGDYDGDGLLDVLLTGYRCLALFRNLGGLRFQLSTSEAGLDAANHGHRGASAGFMDLDRDGWLDLVILNYVDFGPESQQYCEYRAGVRSGCTPRSYPPNAARSGGTLPAEASNSSPTPEWNRRAASAWCSPS